MRLLRSRPFVISLIILGAFVIMVLSVRGNLGAVENGIFRTVAPVATAFSDLRDGVVNVISTARDLRTLRQRNSQLEVLVERLTVENLQLSEVTVENEQLRALLQFRQTSPTANFRGSQIIARIIGDQASPYVNVIQMDLGANHGIATGMPIVTDRGLVGRVINVRPNSSAGMLITDPNSSINAMTQASRALGVLRGRAGQLPLLDLIPADVDLAMGDIVMTSGLGSNFPKGLIIGQIVEVLRNDNRTFQQAVVQPTVDFNRLELILFITDFTPMTDLAPPAVDAPTPAPVTPIPDVQPTPASE